MKMSTLLMALVCISGNFAIECSAYVTAQTNSFPVTGRVGIGTINPDPSSLLEIRSLRKGFLMPRMTMAQRDSILAPAKGLEIYQTNNTPGFYFYDGYKWKQVGADVGANKSLSNLTDIAVNQDLNPLNNISYNLGTFDHAWKNLFLEGQIISQFTGVLDVSYGRSFNVSVGAFSIQGGGAFQSVALGVGALFDNISSYNTGVGTLAMSSVKKGSNNVGLGYRADVSKNWFNNSIALGTYATATASNQARIGNTAVTSIGGIVGWTQIADARFNSNVKENVPGLRFINKLKPITYSVNVSELNNQLKTADRDDTLNKQLLSKDSSLDKVRFSISEIAMQAQSQIVYTGFNAQDVEATAKAINYKFSGVDGPKNSDDFYGLRYGEFVPPLVQAVQELSKQSDSLKQELNYLKCIISLLQSKLNFNSTDQINATDLGGNAMLQQNIPNPFKQQTTISYYVPKTAAKAVIKFMNFKGVTIKVIQLNAKGYGEFLFEKTSLAAGPYTYSLLVDGRLIDTKAMVVTN